MMYDILVSVVILTWERKDDVLAAVKSVYDQEYQNTEIIVVDNASTDGTVEALLLAFPAIRLVLLAQNMGAAAGRNPGILASNGEIIFLLDSDAMLGKDTLSNIVIKFQNSPEISVLACKILNVATRELDPNTWIYSEKDKADQDTEFNSFSLCECGVAFRKKVFDRAGLFWELLFFGREGEELGLRVIKAGYKILYYPKAVIYHRASQQKRVIGGDWEYYNLRNCLYIYLVHYPWWLLVIFVPLKIGSSVLKGLKRRYLRRVFRALIDVSRRLPLLFKERRPMTYSFACHYIKLQHEHGILAWNILSWLKFKV
jgi:GT2 family glycosyltransferase